MKHRLNRSVRKTAAFCLLLALVCTALSSCSFSFSLEDALTQLKAYINGTEVSQPPADFVESRVGKTYTYDVYLDHVVITGYLGEAVEVEIPAKIDKLPVRKIAGLAFYESVDVVSVTVPEGVTELEENAFYYCTALTSVSLPESLAVIGDKAFSWCSSLDMITIPEAVTAIPAYCFNQCSALRVVALPEGITSVGARAFSGCTSLESLQLGNGLASVGDYAFRDCPLLLSVRLPGQCEPTEHAFEGCAEGFTVVTEADSVCWELCTAYGVSLIASEPEDTSGETSSETSSETSDELTVVG